MIRVLVTGANGLLGHRVASTLEARAVDVVRTSLRPTPGMRSVDLRDAEATDEMVRAIAPDIVVHLAGRTRGDAQSLEVDNVSPAENVVRALARHRPGARMLQAGSAAEYGDGHGRPLGEGDVCKPVTDYGRAKLAQTVRANEIANTLGVPLSTARIFNVVASDLPQTTPLGNFRRQLLGQAGRTRTVSCGRTDVERDFVAADDVAGVLANLGLRWEAPAIVNVCSGAPLRLAEVFQATAALLEIDLVLEPDPVLVALPAARSVVGASDMLRSMGHPLHSTPEAMARALVADALR